MPREPKEKEKSKEERKKTKQDETQKRDDGKNRKLIGRSAIPPEATQVNSRREDLPLPPEDEA